MCAPALCPNRQSAARDAEVACSLSPALPLDEGEGTVPRGPLLDSQQPARRSVLAAGEELLDAGGQLVRPAVLPDPAVGAALLRHRGQLLGGARGAEEDGPVHAPRVAQPGDQVGAHDLGQVDVDQDQVRQVSGSSAASSSARSRAAITS